MSRRPIQAGITANQKDEALIEFLGDKVFEWRDKVIEKHHVPLFSKERLDKLLDK